MTDNNDKTSFQVNNFKGSGNEKFGYFRAEVEVNHKMNSDTKAFVKSDVSRLQSFQGYGGKTTINSFTAGINKEF